jgi:protein phosphatase
VSRRSHLSATSGLLRGRLSPCRPAQRKLAADESHRRYRSIARQALHRKARTMSVHGALDVASLSHPGMVRTHNEDSVFVDGEAGLAVLADGMGGYSAGEVASGIAVNVISTGMLEELRSGRELSKVDIGSGLTHAALLLQQQIALANKGIYEAAQARPECAGMGTTLVATVFFQNRVSIGHIGDSRCYRLRVDRFEQLTHDHSLLQEQIDSGMLTQEQAKYSLNKNLVTRALGIEAVVPPDISEYRIEAEDIYVLCSDGLTDMVDAEAVREIVATKRSDLAEAAAELIDVANQNGGRDNVSVVLVRVPEGFLPTGGWLQRWMARKTT